MPDFLFALSSFKLFLFLSSISIITAIITILLIRRFVPAKVQYADNAVIGNISALISIIYGVLTSLIALYLINLISYTSEIVQTEANAVANIYRESKWLPEPIKTRIQKDARQYVHTTVENDWPRMINNQPINAQGVLLINDISDELYRYSQETKNETMVIHEMMNDVKDLYNAREQRIRMSFSELNTETYVVILIGTILTIGISCLFGMNLYLHFFTVSATALMTAAMLFLIISLDRPFQGDFVVDTAGFHTVLKLIDATENNKSLLEAKVPI